MGKPYRATFDAKTKAFSRGLNTALASHLLGPEFAVVAQNVEMGDGTLRGIYGPGSATGFGPASPSGGAVDAAYKWIGFVGNATYIGSADRQHLCSDLASDQAGYGQCYVTNIASGVAGTPRIWGYQGTAGFSSYRLGLAAPTVAPGSTAGTSRQYAYTYVVKDAAGNIVLESNPSPRSGSMTGTANITFTASSDARVVGVNIYATTMADPTGRLYLMVFDGVSPYLDAGYSVDYTKPLNWDAGGSPDQVATIDDHSPAPSCDVISDALHSTTARGTGTSGAGILFVAVNNTDSGGAVVYWSTYGYPQYFPTRQILPINDTVQKITSRQGQTFIHCESAIYVFTGTDGFDLTWSKVALSGPKTGRGQSVVETDVGTVMMAREGIALFDGIAVRLLSEDILDARALNALTDCHAVFYDGHYWLFHSTGTILLDLTDFPRYRFFTSDKIVWGAMIAPASINQPGVSPGLSVMLDAERGNRRRWKLSEAVTGSARLDWIWKTGKITAGSLATPSRFDRFWMQATGVVATFFADDGAAMFKADGLTALNPTGDSWLPATLARGLQVNLAGTGTTANLSTIMVDAEAQDGA